MQAPCTKHSRTQNGLGLFWCSVAADLNVGGTAIAFSLEHASIRLPTLRMRSGETSTMEEVIHESQPHVRSCRHGTSTHLKAPCTHSLRTRITIRRTQDRESEPLIISTPTAKTSESRCLPRAWMSKPKRTGGRLCLLGSNGRCPQETVAHKASNISSGPVVP